MDKLMKNKIDLLSLENTSFNKNELSSSELSDIRFMTKKIVLIMQIKEMFNYFQDIEIIELSVVPNNLEKIKQLYPLPVEIKETEFSVNLNLYLNKKVLIDNIEKPTIPFNHSDINVKDLKFNTLYNSSQYSYEYNTNSFVEWNAQTILSIAEDIKTSPISIKDKYNNCYSNKKFQDEVEIQISALKNDSFMHFLYDDSGSYPSHYSFLWRRSFLSEDIEKFLGIATYTFYEKTILNKNFKNNDSHLDLSSINHTSSVLKNLSTSSQKSSNSPSLSKMHKIIKI
jgi:hypothetical protein